ncbi:MAG: hypothetical protein H6738_18605 [Alphaproteobacteria bacterium]|nr:hypothetical protein [Alphaproteobacteria bacterium]
MPSAVEGTDPRLVALLEVGRHDGQLRTRVIGALRQLEVPGVAACAMAKVPDLGINILDVHRDPTVLRWADLALASLGPHSNTSSPPARPWRCMRWPRPATPARDSR